ncbi:MAG: hydrolase [Planctomycetes bacterium]|nr:hydrolase [Planctomycetota bacterium]
MTELPPRSIELLGRDDSRLLIVDVQERLLAHISVADSLVANCRKLVRAAQILDIPISATEQYPKGLGRTAPELSELLGEIPEKLRFSCSECLAWPPAAEAPDGRHKVIVAGIESHVCVLQTALDLMAIGYRVYVPADAVASRKKFDWKMALERLRLSGAVVTSTESVLFEWCEVAGTPEFKQISELVKDSSTAAEGQRHNQRQSSY